MTRTHNARIAGFTFLLYIGIGIAQMVLSRPMSAQGTAARLALIAQHSIRMRVNILLTVLTCFTALALAVALYGLTRDEDRDLAVFALSCRIGEALFGAIAPIGGLALLWLATDRGGSGSAQTDGLADFFFRARAWNTLIGATLFAVGSTVFSWLLLRGRMVPSGLAWLGVAASLLLVLTLPLQLVGVLAGLATQLVWVPMAAFEVPLGFWLLIKGVRA